MSQKFMKNPTFTVKSINSENDFSSFTEFVEFLNSCSSFREFDFFKIRSCVDSNRCNKNLCYRVKRFFTRSISPSLHSSPKSRRTISKFVLLSVVTVIFPILDNKKLASSSHRQNLLKLKISRSIRFLRLVI